MLSKSYAKGWFFVVSSFPEHRRLREVLTIIVFLERRAQGKLTTGNNSGMGTDHQIKDSAEVCVLKLTGTIFNSFYRINCSRYHLHIKHNALLL